MQAAFLTTNSLWRSAGVKVEPDCSVSKQDQIPATVLKACPEIVIYGPGGTIRSLPDLMIAAVTIRTMLRVDPSAHQYA